MSELLHQFIDASARVSPDAEALLFKKQVVSYSELAEQMHTAAAALSSLGIVKDDRVGIYLPKQPEAIVAMFGASACDGVFVPVNPLLKPRQVAFILADCNVRVLITSAARLQQIGPGLADCKDLQTVIVVEPEAPTDNIGDIRVFGWEEFRRRGLQAEVPGTSKIDADMVGILYTSGSTGNPKGVVLSHRNMVTGAKSAATHLFIGAEDRLLIILPITFDAGLSLVNAGLWRGSAVVLMDYLLARDVIKAIVNYGVTGTSGVPPIWNQLADLEWPQEARDTLRFLTNTGGAMPVSTTKRLREHLPETDIYLMYGLTEAFRSLYLDPSQVDIRPTSVGKAMPNAEVLVVRPDGSLCEPNEPGELVHRGSFVSLGYWNDPEKTAARFKPAPGQHPEVMVPEMAVWSGDEVMRDEEGYIYFISRKDEMIKTSGYRVSPTEVEKVVYESEYVEEAVVLGIEHPQLGKAILLIVCLRQGRSADDIKQHCAQELPTYMMPHQVEAIDSMPRNQNGKIDRNQLNERYQAIFSGAAG